MVSSSYSAHIQMPLRCNLVVTPLALSSVEKAGDVTKIRASQKQAPWTQHGFFTVGLGSFAKSHPLLPGKAKWKVGILACPPWLPVSSGNNGNITMGCFLIMWTAIWNVSNISHACYTLSFPQLDSVVLDFSTTEGVTQCQSQPATTPRPSASSSAQAHPATAACQVPDDFWMDQFCLKPKPMLLNAREPSVLARSPSPLSAGCSSEWRECDSFLNAARTAGSPVHRLSFHKGLFVLFWINCVHWKFHPCI